MQIARSAHPESSAIPNFFFLPSPPSIAHIERARTSKQQTSYVGKKQLRGRRSGCLYDVIPSTTYQWRRAVVRSRASENGNASKSVRDNVQNVSVILLAGGSGSRMKADRPKQFLELDGKSVVEHSLELFAGMKQVSQIILVVAKEYRDRFLGWVSGEKKRQSIEFCFADPGEERQDSVYNGTDMVKSDASLVCIHDAARPLVSRSVILNVLQDAQEYGAAVLGVPSKATIKESDDGKFVLRTIERSRLWEIQTPQVIRPDLLRKGFSKVRKENLNVTDDVSIVEYLGEPVRITMGEYTNIKLTTPEDMNIAYSILKERQLTEEIPTRKATFSR